MVVGFSLPELFPGSTDLPLDPACGVALDRPENAFQIFTCSQAWQWFGMQTSALETPLLYAIDTI